VFHVPNVDAEAGPLLHKLRHEDDHFVEAEQRGRARLQRMWPLFQITRVNRPLAMRKDGIQTRKRKPKNAPLKNGKDLLKDSSGINMDMMS